VITSERHQTSEVWGLTSVCLPPASLAERVWGISGLQTGTFHTLDTQKEVDQTRPYLPDLEPANLVALTVLTLGSFVAAWLLTR